MAEPAYLPSFKLPFLAREKALLQNALILRPGPWRAPFGSGDIVVEPLPESPSFPAACTLSVDIDGDAWLLEANDTSALLRHDVFASEGNASAFDERTLPQEVRRALLESLLHPLFSALRGALNRPLAVQDAAFLPPSESPAFSIGLRAFSLRVQRAASPDAVSATLSPARRRSRPPLCAAPHPSRARERPPARHPADRSS